MLVFLSDHSRFGTMCFTADKVMKLFYPAIDKMNKETLV